MEVKFILREVMHNIGIETTQSAKWPSFHLEFLLSLPVLVLEREALTLHAAQSVFSHGLPNL